LRTDIFITVTSTQEALNFYIDELAMFELKHDYGMGDVLINHVNNPDFCLSLTEGEELPNRTETPQYAIKVENCHELYEKIKSISFVKGGLVKDDNFNSFFMEAPTGQSFTLSDPSGNYFTLFSDSL